MILATACQEDELNRGEKVTSQKGVTTFTITLPEPQAAIRAAWGEPTDTPIENLHVLVFDENGFFIANAKAKVEMQNATSGTFSVKLPISNSPRRLHFIANYDNYDTYSSSDSESSILGNMTTSNGNGAYWGVHEVAYIPNQEEGWTLPGGPVSLLRNFAKVTVKSSTIEGFELLGYQIYNTAPEGLVAPYNPENGTFAQFSLQDNSYTGFMEANPDYKATTIGEVVETIPVDNGNNWTAPGEPIYTYERNQDHSDIPTTIIVKARYEGDEYFYKLDIVSFDMENYETTTYNLLRNFHYEIMINDVKSAGYTSIEEAVSAAASNNLSASILVSQVKKISNGRYELEVSLIDTVVVTSKEFEVTYKYTDVANGNNDITASSFENGQLKVNYEINHDIFSSIDATTPGVIKLQPVSDALLPKLMNTQEIVVATESGLNRRIVIRVRQPFEFVATDCQKLVKAEQKSPFTFIIELPMGMPPSVFPITLQLDVEDNTLYPDASKNLMPVELTNNRDYVYDLKVDYNTYRQNRTVYCHFLTNTANSKTSIVARGSCFKESKKEEFKNGTPLEFTDVNFNDKSANQNPTIPFGAGQDGKLSFKMDSPKNETVRIYTRYLTDPKTTTGTIAAMKNEDGSINGYEYIPTDVPLQIITFKSKDNIAGETIELFNDNYLPALISYTNPFVNVQFTYGPNDIPVSSGIVKVYLDKYYQDFAADLERTNAEGVTNMRSFAGNTYETVLYFLYQSGTNTYRGSKTVRELIEQDGGEGNQITVNLRVQ